MTADPICCTADDDVLHALELMKDHQVRRLPVVNMKREIVGILALSDLVRKKAVVGSEIVAALQRICEPGHEARKSVTEIVTAA
jgi:CBS domain-containing protein